jgi:hypothetical protein
MPASDALVQEHRVEHLARSGFSPKEMFETPSVKCTSGWAALSCRMASMVSMPSRRTSSWPVEIGKVRASMMMSSSAQAPVLRVMSAISRSAIRDLPLRGARLALFVDGQGDHRGAVLA